MNWGYADRLQYASLGGGGEAWYVYDASGERVRKVIKNRDIVEDRLLGGYQSWTKTVNGQVAETRESLHVNDRTKRIAILNGDKKATTIRYQYDNHLGSACLELDDRANIITYEEYHPYTCKSSSKGLCGGATWIEFGIHLHIKKDDWYDKIDAAYKNGCKIFDGVINGIGVCPMTGYELLGNLPTGNILEYAQKNNIPLTIDKKKFTEAQVLAFQIAEIRK